jgi:hypothetical protein
VTAKRKVDREAEGLTVTAKRKVDREAEGLTATAKRRATTAPWVRGARPRGRYDEGGEVSAFR